MLQLQEGFSVTRYLAEKVASVVPMLHSLVAEGKPQYLIEELCLEQLTADLKPSRFNYLKTVMEEEFPREFARMKEAGVLTSRLIEFIYLCKPVFESFDFSEENQLDMKLRHAVIAELHHFLI